MQWGTMRLMFWSGNRKYSGTLALQTTGPVITTVVTLKLVIKVEVLMENKIATLYDTSNTVG